MDRKHEKDLYFGVILLIIGYILFGVAPITTVRWFLLTLLFGMSCGVSGIAIIMLTVFPLKRLKQNKTGALWTWTVCLLAIVVLAVGWFVLSWPAYMIIEMIENIYAFPPEATSAITLIKNVIAWFLILMALGLLLWAYVSSQRREDITFPAG